MTRPRLVMCSGSSSDGVPADVLRRSQILHFDSIGPEANVHVRFENVAKVFNANLPGRLVDLIEIAAYVFTADCATDRGRTWKDDSIEPWEREFYFCIPVRDHAFWTRPDVIKLLTGILEFLTNDRVTFNFLSLDHDRPFQQYLQFGEIQDWPFQRPERVLMFSGGLDSLAGAIDTLSERRNTVLVSHRPVAATDTRQKRLVQALREQFPQTGILHVPVWVNKATNFGREATQRSRSFLFGSLGLAVAASTRAGGIRFFENGVVSLNLPVADEVLRARASRTTHPITLRLMQELFSIVLERSVTVDNPYIYFTKTEVVSRIKAKKAANLIPHTCSCAHSMFKPKQQWHCGTCSQCIDRRIAILASGLAEYDSDTDYESDVFVGPRRDGYERNMAVDYVRHGLELNQMHEIEMAERFNLEFVRATRYEERQSEAAKKLMDMHRRHGQAVSDVLQQQIEVHSPTLVHPGLDRTSMLAMLVGQEHLEPNWRRYSARIVQRLHIGIPIACQTEKPTKETRLQEIADGILTSNQLDLVREFPFMRWASRMTKPDWSAEPFRVFVEMKYIRKKDDIHRVSEEMAADITKYGDNGVRVLFVVYDPNHLILKEEEFRTEVNRRDNMQLAIIR